jgi:hypothetical protein
MQHILFLREQRSLAIVLLNQIRKAPASQIRQKRIKKREGLIGLPDLMTGNILLHRTLQTFLSLTDSILKIVDGLLQA